MIFSLLIVIFWLILLGYWFISALGSKKSTRGNLWWQRQLGIRIVLIIVIIFLIRMGVFARIAAVPVSVPLGVIGVILCGAGVALAIWARAYLGRNWGMPMTLQEGHELVTSGPYAWVRHPIYTGFLLAMLGSAFAADAIWFVIVLVSGIYFIYAAKTEEKIMLKQFPDEYPPYIKRTKMLVPFVL